MSCDNSNERQLLRLILEQLEKINERENDKAEEVYPLEDIYDSIQEIKDAIEEQTELLTSKDDSDDEEEKSSCCCKED
jgi:hypothetical protein